MSFKSAISRILTNEKSLDSLHSNGERFTPPLIRHAEHKFAKAGIYKDAHYHGTWLSGKVHGLWVISLIFCCIAIDYFLRKVIVLLWPSKYVCYWFELAYLKVNCIALKCWFNMAFHVEVILWEMSDSQWYFSSFNIVFSFFAVVEILFIDCMCVSNVFVACQIMSQFSDLFVPSSCF